jgi:c(7)-type cytochrome triheme protein
MMNDRTRSSPRAAPRVAGAAAVLALALGLALVLALGLGLATGPARAQAAPAIGWAPLAGDGLHDPKGPAIGLLQEPAAALSVLPPDTAGNKVGWMRALDGGFIKPRSTINPDLTVNLRTTEVLLKRTGEMPMVRFPHRQHTLWLDCVNCHSGMFEMRAGATKNNMFLILQGEKCGVCHGAVAFPLTECQRCHSVARGSPEAAAFGQGLVRE